MFAMPKGRPSSSPPANIVPGIGPRSTNVRGTVAQRRLMYQMFRAHTEEVLERLLGIIRDDKTDPAHVIQAGKEILNRGWGAVPQTQIVEAGLKHQHGIDVDAVRQLPDEALRQLEATLARIVRLDGDVIDATPVRHGEDEERP
jgi:hypothetical protein